MRRNKAKSVLALTDRSGGFSGRRRVRGYAVLFSVLFCGLLLSSSSASALVQRGHVFGSTFEGTGENAFTNPSGIAVNESTGEVYVVDGGGERVERFKPDGKGGFEFVSAFDVPNPRGIAIDNAVGSPSRGDVYVPGIEKAPKKGEEPETERNFLYKYTATGEKLYKKHIFKHKEKNSEGEVIEPEEAELEEIFGVGVDATGKLWVTWGEEGYIAGFTNEETNKLINSTYKESALTTEQPPQFESQLECPAKPGFAVAPKDEYFYLAHEHENSLEECLEGETPVVVAKLANSGKAVASALNQKNTTGVAVDSANGNTYIDNVTSVAAFSSDGSSIQSFGEGHLTSGGPLAVNSENGEFAGTRGDVFVADGSKIEVFVQETEATAPTVDSIFAQDLTPSSTRLTARIDPRGSDTHYYFQYGTVSCVTTPSACTDVPAAPGADLGSGFGDQTAETVLEGLLPDTTYYYRVVAENGLGTGTSSQTADTFFVTLPSAEGVLADNREWEMVSPPTKGGLLEAMTNQGPAAIQASEDGSGLAYGSAFSGPLAEPEGNRSIAVTQSLFARGEGGWSVQDITTPHPRGEWFKPGAQLPEYRLFSSDLALSVVEPEAQQIFPVEQAPLSPLLEHEEKREKTIYVRDNPPFSPSAGEKQLYEEAAKSHEYLAPGYFPLVTQLNATAGNPFGFAMGETGNGFVGATPDLNHIVLSSPVPLTAGATAEGLYEWNSASPQSLQLVSVLPDEKSAQEPVLGGHAIARDAISEDGSHVIFTSSTPSVENEPPENEAAFLFTRDMATGKTVRVNAVQGEHTKEANQEEQGEEGVFSVHFEAASNDGSRIYFKDTWPLTDESRLDPTESLSVNPSDLYEFNTSTGNLTDLTVDEHAGESADVLGTLPGISEDGSYVYFVANGALTADAQPGDCPSEPVRPPPAGASCNLYVIEPDPQQAGARRTRLIARLSAADAPDWGEGGEASEPNSALAGNLIQVSSRVSPNGLHLAFMSNASLTGYDNEDKTSGATGEKLDEEVYLYDAGAGRVICASCNADGSRPSGVFDTEASGEGSGLLVDRSSVWNGSWLAGSVPGWTPAGVRNAIYQSRYLSDSGRLFFNSPEKLVSDDGNEKEDVYEYEQQGSGTCQSASGCVSLVTSGSKADEHESAFLDASASGNDVFFLTSEKLLAQDYDTSLDIYDARVCGTSDSSPCLPPKSPPPLPCKEENECKSTAPGAPGFQSSATATFSGPGNTAASGVLPNKSKAKPKPPTRAQKLAKALKACKKLKKKKKRVACEQQARKKYGAKKKAKKKSHAKKSASRSGERK